MKTCIVHPPHVEPESLPLAAARLAAQLQQPGHQVELVDANQQAWQRWLDPQHLQRQVADMRAVRDRLGNADTLAGAEAWNYHRAVRGSVGFAGLLAALVPARAELARSGPGVRRTWAKRIVESALDIGLWPATGVASLNDLTLLHSTESSADVLAAARSTSGNPFTAFWTQWLDARDALPDTFVLWLDADQQLIPAATLAVVLASRGTPTPLRLAGPFAEFLRRCDEADGQRRWQGVFDGWIELPDHPPVATDAMVSFVRSLAQQQLLGSLVVALTAETGDISAVPRLLDDLRALHAGSAARPHVETPLTVSALLALADGAGRQAPGLVWSASVKFGFHLDRAAAERLRSAGCAALHFEIKGFAGYAMPAGDAAGVLRSSLSAARASGLTTLGSVVYGFPSDDDASFVRFVSTMRDELDAVDQWVRFRVYRLYRFSDAWRDPESWEIAQVLPPDAGKDLCRHVDFVSRHGPDSRTFREQALRSLAAFGRRGHDFPASPMLSDDAGMAAGPAATGPAGFGEQDLLEAIPDDAAQAVRFPFAAMDKVYGTHVPGPERGWPGQCFTAIEPAWLARGFQADKLSAIGTGTLKLLQQFRTPTPATAVASQLTRAAGGDGHALMRRMVQMGLMRVRSVDP